MPRTYTVEFDSVAITAAQDLFEITPGDDKPCRILGIVFGQTSDVGDANSENLGLRVIRGYTASGSGGSAGTGLALDPADASCGFTCEVNNTTVANTGSPVTLFADVINTQAGYCMFFPEGMQPQVNQGQSTLVVRITAPADSITASGTLFVQEP